MAGNLWLVVLKKKKVIFFVKHWNNAIIGAYDNKTSRIKDKHMSSNRICLRRDATILLQSK